MSRWATWALLWAALCCVLALPARAQSGAPSPAGPRLRAVVLLDSAPLQFRDEKSGRASGLAVDVMDRVAERAGLKVDYVFATTWEEAVELVARGRVDVAASLAISPEREKSLLFTQPIHASNLSTFVRSGAPRTKQLASAESVGVQSGSVAARHVDAPRRVEYRSIEEGLFALLAGEVDAFVAAEELVLKEARDARVDDRIRVAGPPVANVRRAMAVRAGNTALHARLNRALDGFVSSVEYQNIYSRWYGKPKPFWDAQRVTLLMLGLLAVTMLGMALWRYRSMAQLNLELRRSIRERERAEGETRLHQARLTGILRSMPIAMWAVDENGTFTLSEGNVAPALGLDLDAFVGKSLDSMTERLPALMLNLQRSLAGTEVETTLEIGERAFDTYCSPLRDPDGAILGAFAIASDVTARRQLEEEMRRSHKLESVGVLAGGIAHDFNNLLAAILGNINLARRSLGDGARRDESLLEAEKAARRASDLTRQLLTFARGGAPIRAAVSVDDVIREAAGFAVTGSNVRCEYDLAAELSPVHADRGQLAQVVQNLVLNAAQAMPEGGSVVLGAENVTVPAGSKLPLAPGEYVRISVRDHGEGIAPEHRAKIFDPYFTTKTSGQGLGLAITYSIVKKHDGYLAVESELGRGSTFFVYLPATEATESMRHAAAKDPCGGRGRVLFMDDEPAVRRITERLLRELGYQPVCTADGAEAVAQFVEARADGRPFDAVIADLTVPGGAGGVVTLERIREFDARVPVIVASGYSEDPVMADHATHGFSAALPKPYTLEELGRVLGRVLREPSERSVAAAVRPD